MQNYQKLIIFTIFSVLLFSQISLVSFAHHDDGPKKDRQEAEEVTKRTNEENRKKYDEIRDAWKDYWNSFKLWKIAKENHKKTVSDGNQAQIDISKKLLDQSILDVKKAFNEYQKIKKENS